MCCQCVRFGAAIYLNPLTRVLSFIHILLIVCPAAFRQVIGRYAVALFSNHALTVLGTFLTPSCVWQVLYASTIAVAAFLFPVRTMCHMCVVAIVVILLCALPFSRLLFT